MAFFEQHPKLPQQDPSKQNRRRTANESPQRKFEKLPNEPENPQRRQFLKRLAIGALAASVAGKTFYELATATEKSSDESDASKENEVSINIRNLQMEESLALEDEFEVGDKYDEQSDTESEIEDYSIVEQRIRNLVRPIEDSEIENQFSFDNKNEIKIDSNFKQRLYQKYYKFYKKGPDLESTGNGHKGLVESFERISPWIDELKSIFAKNGVPEKYIYLSIAESDFKIRRTSHAGAKGPFQFTKPTARLYDMTVTPTIDEREDPLKSAAIAAKKLNYLFRLYKDWDLVVKAYNGGFVERYRKKREEEGKTNLSDNDFLTNYIPHILNQKKSITKNSSLHSFTYRIINNKVTKDDIRKKFGERKISKLSDTDYLIPLRNNSQRKRMYEAWANIPGILENLNYSAKVNAICNLIEEYDWENKNRRKLRYTNYTIRNAGQSLRDVARVQRVELSDLKKINPAILNHNGDLPRNYTVRIPRERTNYISLS